MTDINIEERLNEIRRREGFFKSISLSETDASETDGSIIGMIHLGNHDLQLQYPSTYEETAMKDKKTSAYVEKKAEERKKELHAEDENESDGKDKKATSLVLEENDDKDKKATSLVLEDILYHEIGHRGFPIISGCPIDIEHKERDFTDPINQVLQTDEDTVAYVSNMITDVIDNINCRQKTDLSGMFLHFDNEGRKVKKYTLVYDSFVRLQLSLFGGKDEISLLDRYSTKRKEVRKAVSNIMKRAGLSMGKEEQNLEYLMNPENWQNFSKIYAEEVKSLLEKEQPKESLFGSGGKGSQGRKKQGRGQGKQQGKGKQGQDKEDKDGAGNGMPKDGFSEELKDPTNRRRFVLQRYLAGKNAPSYMDSFESLQYLYEALAARIPVETDSLTKSHDFPIVTLRHRPFENTDDITRITPKIILDGIKPALSVAELKYSIPLGVKAGVTNYPDFQMVLLDTSESTRHSTKCSGLCSYNCMGKVVNPSAAAEQQWGDKSKYHYELLAWYGIRNYLTGQGLLRSISTSLVNFSSQTRTARNLEEATKLAFTPQFGNTMIDVEKVKSMFPPSARQKVIFSLSDGEVQGWENIQEEYIKMARQNMYFHIQFGPDSVMSNALRKAGLPVYNIDTGDQLTRLAVNLTRKTYEGYARK
ncbi:hypothetical protein HZA33_00660 [Candidatus Pacearchaeota archaeon]|nr:hypothetical protein [Candidatus Pacearchaeota archaeon]